MSDYKKIKSTNGGYVDIDHDAVGRVFSGVDLSLQTSPDFYSDEYKTQNYISCLYKELNQVIKQFEMMKNIALRYGLNVESIPEPNPPVNETLGIVKASTLNIRSDPSTNNDSIGQLKRDEKINIVGMTSDGWYEIKLSDGKVGYVSSDYIKTENRSD